MGNQRFLWMVCLSDSGNDMLSIGRDVKMILFSPVGIVSIP